MTELLIKLFIKNPKALNDKKVRENYGTLASFMGIVWNVVLSAIKILAGALSGSISIIADGINNLTDMGSSVITMIGFKVSSKPADKDHPYGHGRMEYMSAFIISALILLVGFELFKESATALLSGEKQPTYSALSIIILAVSILVKFWLFLFNRKIAKKINAASLFATAQDCLNDSITTSAILVSVVVSKFIAIPFSLDAVMGIAVSAFILFSGYSLAKDTINVILGKPPEKELIKSLESTILSFEGFIGVHDLIVHNYGPGREFASVHVEVPQNIDIVKCHERIDLCEKLVKEKLDVELVIHMDPVETDNEEINSAKAVITNALKEINGNLSLHDFRMTPKCENRTNFIFDVVLPSELEISEKELRQRIDDAVKKINPTYYTVITFDNDFTGR